MNERAHTQRDIDALLDQTDHPIIKDHVHCQLGVCREEFRQARNNVQTGKGHCR